MVGLSGLPQLWSLVLQSILFVFSTYVATSVYSRISPLERNQECRGDHWKVYYTELFSPAWVEQEKKVENFAAFLVKISSIKLMWCNKRSDQLTHNFRGESEILGLGRGAQDVQQIYCPLWPGWLSEVARRKYYNAIKKVSWCKQSYCI